VLPAISIDCGINSEGVWSFIECALNQEFVMAEENQIPLSIHVNQSHVRNAVRDIVKELLLPEAAQQSFDSHVEKQKKRLDAHVDQVISSIAVPQNTVNTRVANLLERNLSQMVKDIVSHEVQKVLRDEVSVAIRHIVQTGLTLEIGTGWKQKVQISTELKEG
jgi:hypothetical protein